MPRPHLLDALDHPQTAADVVAAMTHHDDAGGVCRHNFVDPDPVLWHRTLATVAIDVTGRSLDVTDGGPCGHHDLPAAG